MIEDGIFDGDYVIVERNPSPKMGMVVALLDNSYATLKRFYRERDRIRLQPANSTMKPIYCHDPLIQGSFAPSFASSVKRSRVKRRAWGLPPNRPRRTSLYACGVLLVRHPKSHPFYAAHGFVVCGIRVGFCRDAVSPRARRKRNRSANVRSRYDQEKDSSGGISASVRVCPSGMKIAL